MKAEMRVCHSAPTGERGIAISERISGTAGRIFTKFCVQISCDRLTVARYCSGGVFRRGWVTLNADFRVKGASPTNHSWYQSSRVIAIACGIKISAVRHLVLSQCTRVTDGQNYDSQDHPRICSRGKNGGLDQYGAEPFKQQ